MQRLDGRRRFRETDEPVLARDLFSSQASSVR